MKIIKKNSDYYDSAMSFYSGDGNIYIRNQDEINIGFHDIFGTKPSTIDFADDELNHVYTSFSTPLSNIARFRVIVFCGKLYPCMVFDLNDTEEEVYGKIIGAKLVDIKLGHKRAVVFNLEEALRISEEIIERDRCNNRYNNDIKKIERLFNCFDDSKHRFNLIPFHIATKAPYALISFASSWVKSHRDKITVIINPNLKELSFAKVFDAYTCYQEIEMLVDGVLPASTAEVVNISDIDKIASHGFNEKSFRKEKTK